MTKQSSYTFKLDREQQSELAEILRSGNYKLVPLEHTIVAAEQPYCKIALYKSGKCLVQGKDSEDFVSFVLEPLILRKAHVGYEEILEPESFQPHMGVDESGKGDYFGPLVIAAVYVDPDIVKTMKEMDLRESKRITSDRKALSLAADLRRLLRDKYALVTIGPPAYNRLYHKMRNVNRMLAWAHARAIENLLAKVPSCPRAISDQFGNKQQVTNALMQKGRSIELVQRHRAESDPAVAAASVLARGAFLQALAELGKRFSVPFHKGASAAVIQSAEELLKKGAPTVLLETAKCHFKTTEQVLSKFGLQRSALGPEGEAVSKNKDYRPKT